MVASLEFESSAVAWLYRLFCALFHYSDPYPIRDFGYRGGPVDMWALGVVLFFLLTGLLPYRGATVGQVRRLVLENRGLPVPEFVSPAASSLYHKLTARPPSDRPTVTDIISYANKPTEGSKQPVNGRPDSDKKCQFCVIQSDGDTWTTWLSGQIFPKALPRFNRCAPLLCSLRQKVSETNNPGPMTTDISRSIAVRPTYNQSSKWQSTGRLSASGIQPNATSQQNNCLDSVEVVEGNAVYDKEPDLATTASEEPSTQSQSTGKTELEAARLLLDLGVTKEELLASNNLDSRSAVTGAYRIILHRLHRQVSLAS
ncbi:hypothetical protein EG68_04866 [Paragonimus skrjabini miyazakii]|uniref:Protein kinase domain-containing protein n=1 Tax=Paragonimus skrjabini miyazakii TaxID=59628 RepID=A0A8S9Z2I0_9TREM|nr:hypothetical protein EG68_04866 [Paragonimus skrjabini miyazakii]